MGCKRTIYRCTLLRRDILAACRSCLEFQNLRFSANFPWNLFLTHDVSDGMCCRWIVRPFFPPSLSILIFSTLQGFSQVNLFVVRLDLCQPFSTSAKAQTYKILKRRVIHSMLYTTIMSLILAALSCLVHTRGTAADFSNSEDFLVHSLPDAPFGNNATMHSG